jgi:hypothetical protein
MAIAERNYLRGVLRAFVTGKKNENYVLGCFRNVPIRIYDEICSELREYADRARFRELYEIRLRLEKQLEMNPSKTRWSPWVLGKY